MFDQYANLAKARVVTEHLSICLPAANNLPKNVTKAKIPFLPGQAIRFFKLLCKSFLFVCGCKEAVFISHAAIKQCLF